MNLVSFRALADDGKLTAEEAIKILQSVNPNIANYDIRTHLVTFKDGSKPVYVTPKGEHPQNGEVTWDYFVEQKGDLRGWLKLPFEEMIKEKARIVKEFEERNGIIDSGSGNLTQTTSLPDSKYVSITQYPQECSNWCGPAATESVLSGWGIGSPSIPIPSQSEIASREQIACGSNYGASEDNIASTLNWYLQENWYSVNHWGYDPQNLWLIVYVDIGYDNAAFVSECDTVYLNDWRNNVSDGKTKNRVHYIAIRGYWTPTDSTPTESDWKNATIAYTDSATTYYNVHAYASEKFYGGITYSSIPTNYLQNPQEITSIYNANLRWPVIG
ncbi:MAG: hypothetical protein ACP5H0_06845 [Caldisericum sp.]|uniref:hypothetical protein n=1 Tax=Caldisericum sp. TaxID=2499687 RepID=UPI003D112958